MFSLAKKPLVSRGGEVKKILNLVVLTVFSLGVSLWILPEVRAESTLRAGFPDTILADKRCEKCERGPDGKIVCKPVPCPN